MRPLASLIFLALSFAPLHAQECDVAAIAVSEPRYGTVGGHSISAIAANENGAFGVWRHLHAGFGSVIHTVLGAPLDASGSPRLPAHKLYLHGTPSVDVATDGTNYLLAGAINGTTYAKIIDAAGAELTSAINVVSGPGAQRTVHAVWNGDAYAVFTSSDGKPILALVSASGEVLSTTVVAETGEAVGIARAGEGRVLTIWRQGSRLLATFFAGSTPIGDARPLSEFDESSLFAVETDGTGFLLAWRDTTSVRVLRLDSTAAVIGNVLTLGTFGQVGYRAIEVVREGQDYLVLWNAPMTTASRIRASGEFTPAFVIRSDEFSSATAHAEGTIILTRRSCGGIVSSFLPHRATSDTPGRSVSTAAVAPGRPAIDRANRAIVWRESLTTEVSCGNESRLMARVGSSPPMPLTPGSAAAGTYATESLGASTFVFFDEYEGGQLPGVLRMARFNQRGERIATTTIASGRFFFDVRASSNGSRILLTWSQLRPDIFIFDVYAAMISAAGEVAEGPVLLNLPSDDPLWIVSATSPSRSLVAWLDHATTIVTIDIGSSLADVRRMSMPLPAGVTSFVTAAVREDAAVILATGYDGTRTSLVAIDPLNGTSTALPRNVRSNLSAQIDPSADGWNILFAEGVDAVSTVFAVALTEIFGEPSPVFCVPALPHAISFGTGVVTYTNGGRVYLQQPGLRRRVIRR